MPVEVPTAITLVGYHVINIHYMHHIHNKSVMIILTYWQYLQKQQQTEQDQGIWSCEERYRKQDRLHEQHRQEKMREYVFWNGEDKCTVKDKWPAFDGRQDDQVGYEVINPLSLSLSLSWIFVISRRKERERERFLPACTKQIKNINSIITSGQDNGRIKLKNRGNGVRSGHTEHTSLGCYKWENRETSEKKNVRSRRTSHSFTQWSYPPLTNTSPLVALSTPTPNART